MQQENEKLEVKLNEEINRTADLRSDMYDALDAIESLTNSYSNYKKTFRMKSFKEYVADLGEEENFDQSSFDVDSAATVVAAALKSACPNVDCFWTKRTIDEKRGEDNPVHISYEILNQSNLFRLYAAKQQL